MLNEHAFSPFTLKISVSDPDKIAGSPSVDAQSEYERKQRECTRRL
jgi:hypothetical protein